MICRTSDEPDHIAVGRAVPSPRALSWLLILPERRTPEQTAPAEKVCASCPSLVLCRDLALCFRDMLRRRAADKRDGWLARAGASGLAAFARLVRGTARTWKRCGRCSRWSGAAGRRRGTSTG